MKANDISTKPMGKALLHTYAETPTKASENKIKHTDLVFTDKQEAQFTKVTEEMIFNKVTENKLGLMAAVIKDTTNQAKNMDLGLIFGLMVKNTQVLGKVTKYMEKECMCEMMGGDMKDSDSLVKCMGKGVILGLMVGSMKESIKKIGRMGLECIGGLMEDSIMGFELMDFRMEMGILYILME